MRSIKTLNLICLILGTILVLSCQKWNPSVDEIKEICGTPSLGASILRFTEPDGSPLYASAPYDFNVQFQDLRGSWHELRVNTKGCVDAPRDDGTLVARSLGRSWVRAETYKAASASRYMELPVHDAAEARWTMACPREGLVADDRLDQLISFSGTGSEAFQVQILATSQRDRVARPVLKKTVGLRWEGPSLDLGALAEGAHELQLFAGFAGPNPFADEPSARCPLTIVRHVPDLQSEPITDDKVLSVNSELIPHKASADDQLFVCRAAGHAESCEALSACSRPEHFTATDRFIFDLPGRQTYVYFLKNRAGRANTRACRRVFVSEKAPDFSLHWADRSWEASDSIVAAAPSVFTAVFENQGHSLEADRPQSQYSCKVDFMMNNDLVVRGYGVRCLNGACKGQELSEFVPCSSPLRFAAGKALEVEGLLDSELRVTVRADDGAGQTTTQVRRLLLQNSQNAMLSSKPLFPVLDNNDDVTGFWYPKTGGLLIRLEDTNAGPIFRFLADITRWHEASEWKDVPRILPENQPVDIVDLATADDGTILASWMYRDHADRDRRTVFSRFENGQWQPFQSKDWNPVQKNCRATVAESDQSLLCLSNYNLTNALYRVTAGQPTQTFELPSPKANCLRSIMTGLRNAKGEVFFICGRDEAFKRSPDGRWTTYKLPADTSVQRFSAILGPQGSPSFVMKKTGAQALIVTLSETVEIVPLPSDFSSPIDSLGSTKESFAFDSQERLRAGALIWDKEAQTWTMDQDLVDVLDDSLVQVRPIGGEPGALLFQTGSFTLIRRASGAEQLFPRKAVGWWGANFSQGLLASESGPRLGQRGEFCLANGEKQAHMLCILRKPWAQIGNPATRLIEAVGNKGRFRTETGSLIVEGDKGFYVRQGRHWTQLMPFLDKLTDRLVISPENAWADTIGNKIFQLDRKTQVWTEISGTGYVEGEFGPSFNMTRRALRDNLGQVWFHRANSPSFIVIKDAVAERVPLPEGHRPIEWFVEGLNIILLTATPDSRLKIFAIDSATRRLTERQASDWGFDFSEFPVFAQRDDIGSSYHEDAMLLFLKKGAGQDPLLLDFRKKRQTRIQGLPLNREHRLKLARLVNESFVIIADLKKLRDEPENASFHHIHADGTSHFLLDLNTMRALDRHPRLQVRPTMSSLDANGRMWVHASEYEADAGSIPGVLFLDLNVLGQDTFWKPRLP